MEAHTLGSLLKSGRHRHHLTLRSVAATMGCDFTYLCKIEHDDTIPAERLIVGLARLYDLDPDVLMVAAGKAPADLAALLARDVDAIRALRRWSADRMRGGATMTTTSRERREHVVDALIAADTKDDDPSVDYYELADAALSAALPDRAAFEVAVQNLISAALRDTDFTLVIPAKYALRALVYGADDAQAGEVTDIVPCMPRVNGKPFYCECGANVFGHNRKTDTFICNGCHAEYAGERAREQEEGAEHDGVG